MAPHRRSPSALRRTAVHEAGHALAAYVLGLECSKVSIVPDWDAGEAGHCTYPTDPLEIMGQWDTTGVWHRTERSAQRASAIALLAGAAAEREVLGRAGPGAADDRRRAGWLVDDLTPAQGNVRHTLARLERTAARLVHRHRAALARVADTLVAQRTLDGEQVRALVAGRAEALHGAAL